MYILVFDGVYEKAY